MTLDEARLIIGGEKNIIEIKAMFNTLRNKKNRFHTLSPREEKLLEASRVIATNTSIRSVHCPGQSSWVRRFT
jgi:hypothetical protein